MREETMIIEGVNCWRTRSIYYAMAITSSLGCLTTTLVQLRSLPSWGEDTGTVTSLLIFATVFLVQAFWVVRSLCDPVPTITSETRRMGAVKRLLITFYYMLIMFLTSYKGHSVVLGIYMFGSHPGLMAIRQLFRPAQDVYIQHVVFINLLCCLSGFLGYQRHVWLTSFVFAALVILSPFVHRRLDKARPFRSKAKQA